MSEISEISEISGISGITEISEISEIPDGDNPVANVLKCVHITSFDRNWLRNLTSSYFNLRNLLHQRWETVKKQRILQNDAARSTRTLSKKVCHRDNRYRV